MDRPASAKIISDCGSKGNHSVSRTIGLKYDLGFNGSHPHSPGYLPDCCMRKSNGFFAVIEQLTKLTDVAATKKQLQTAVGAKSTLHSKSQLFEYIADKSLLVVDNFHMFGGGTLKDTMKAAHYLITKNNAVMTKIWTKMYQLGITLSPFQQFVNMSCFLATKVPNKFTFIYNAAFAMIEVIPFVSLRHEFISQLSDPQRQRNIQDFLNNIVMLLSGWSMLHSDYSNSRLVLLNYILPAFTNFWMKLQQLQRLTIVEMDGVVNNNHNNVVDNALIEISDQVSTVQMISNPDNNNNSNVNSAQSPAFVDLPSIVNDSENKQNDQMGDYIQSIIGKPNARLHIQKISDCYDSPSTVGDTSMFEQGLRDCKRIFRNLDKRFLNDRLIRQLSDLQSAKIWNNWYSDGANGSPVLTQPYFTQCLSLKVRSGELLIFLNCID